MRAYDPALRARAAALRERGFTYSRIGGELAVPTSTVYRWLNPQFEQCQRTISLAWKRRNPERVRAYDAAHRNGGVCSLCGGPMTRENDGGECKSCRRAAVELRRHDIEAMWAEGKLLREIAAAIGWNKDSLVVEIDQMRKAGYSLPRRRPFGHKAVAA